MNADDEHVRWISSLSEDELDERERLRLRRELYEGVGRGRVELLVPLPWRDRVPLAVKGWRDRRCVWLTEHGCWRLARWVWQVTGW